MAVSKASQVPRFLQSAEAERFGIGGPLCLKGVAKNDEGGNKSFAAKIGVPRAPAEFIEQAKQLVDRFDTSDMIDDPAKKNLFAIHTKGPKKMEATREDKLEYKCYESNTWPRKKMPSTRNCRIAGKRLSNAKASCSLRRCVKMHA